MALPEDRQQLIETDEVRIIDDPHRLAMVAQGVVFRVLSMTAGIADGSGMDSLETPEPGVGSPESPQSERRGFNL